MKPYESPKAEIVKFSEEDSACVLTSSTVTIPGSTTVPLAPPSSK